MFDMVSFASMHTKVYGFILCVISLTKDNYYNPWHVLHFLSKHNLFMSVQTKTGSYQVFFNRTTLGSFGTDR